MAAPNTDDLGVWLELGATPGADKTAWLTECLGAAKAAIEGRCVTALLDPYPAEVRTAVLMLGGRLYKRRSSPEGVAGFGDLGVIRVLSQDPDIEALIGRYLKLNGFA